ncbi:MAG TPA: FRG domain-containing protein, partial [Candidatus Eisenbacteria bacterium]|nr:FRG domain-containing protein [Candidatus Eisenbacteria bacterium]
MNEIKLSSWEEFKEYVAGDSYSRLHGPLYRGQADARWQLETTLDRIGARLSIKDYYQKLRSVDNSLYSCFGFRHELDSFDAAEELYHASNIKVFAFMAYVRHLGYPSPLLDWTKSPYIAAYF